MPRIGVSPWGLFDPDIASLSFGVGGEYFVANGLSLGLDLGDTIYIYRSAFKAQNPDIETQLPTNRFEIIPTLRYVFFRSRWFSPYVRGGLGPVFFNHGAGTHGQWVAGPGVFINLRGSLYLDLGVGFSKLFPAGRCNDALMYRSEEPLDVCSFQWAPQFGFVYAFGGGGRERERRPPREPEREPAPATNPLDETVAPEPVPSDVGPPPPGEVTEPPPVGPQPDPAAAPPAEGDALVDEPAEGTEPDAAPTEGTEPDDPAAPTEGTEPEVAAPTAAPGSTDVPLPPQPRKIASPR